jgi:hypothetical protein
LIVIDDCDETLRILFFRRRHCGKLSEFCPAGGSKSIILWYTGLMIWYERINPSQLKFLAFLSS